MQPSHDLDWHALDADAVLAATDGRREGLTESEIEARLARYGADRLRPVSKQGPFMRFLLQFHNVLI